MENNKLVYSVREVQSLLGLSRGLVYEAIRRGDIPSIHIGRRVLIPRVALERLLQQGMTRDSSESIKESSKNTLVIGHEAIRGQNRNQ